MGWFTRWLRAQPLLSEADAGQVDEFGEAINPNLAASIADRSARAYDQAIIGARTRLLKEIEYAAGQGDTHITIFAHGSSAPEFANFGYLRRCGFRTIKDGKYAVRVCWGPEDDVEEPFVGCKPPDDAAPLTERPMPRFPGRP